MIDDKMLTDSPHVPVLSIMLNQLTSSQAVRAILVFLSFTLIFFLVVTNQPVPDSIIAILFSIVGYYFGEAAPRPSAQKSN